MAVIRVVVQHSPSLYAILGAYPVDSEFLTLTLKMDGQTFYRAETHDTYVLYRAALSGWGAGGTFDSRQR